MPRHHQSDRPRIREAARQHVDSPGRRRMTPAEIAARKAEREKRKRETPSMLVERRIAREQPAMSEPPRPRTVSRQNEVARVISLPGRLTPVSWQLPNDLTYEDWLHYGKMLTQMQGAIQWALGDWWVHGEHKYGKRVKALRDGAFGTYAIQTLKNFAWVAKHVETSRRRDVLTFGHHEAVAALPAAQQKHWLERAARERLSVHRLRKSIKAAPLVRPPSEPSESRSSRRLTRREQTEVAALRAHVEELEAARASAPTAPDQTIRKAVTVLFGLLVEQVGRGGAADLLHDNLNNRERAALAGVVTDTSFRLLLADDGRD